MNEKNEQTNDSNSIEFQYNTNLINDTKKEENDDSILHDKNKDITSEIKENIEEINNIRSDQIILENQNISKDNKIIRKYSQLIKIPKSYENEKEEKYIFSRIPSIIIYIFISMICITVMILVLKYLQLSKILGIMIIIFIIISTIFLLISTNIRILISYIKNTNEINIIVSKLFKCYNLGIKFNIKNIKDISLNSRLKKEGRISTVYEIIVTYFDDRKIIIDQFLEFDFYSVSLYKEIIIILFNKYSKYFKQNINEEQKMINI